MTIASEIQNYANGLGDAYDAVNDMGGIIPQDKNMNNLDTAIRTIPQTPSGHDITFFFFDETTRDLYKEDTYTTVATHNDVEDAYLVGVVVIKDGELNTDIGNEGLTVTGYDSNSIFCVLSKTSDGQTWDVRYTYDEFQTPKWSRVERRLQPQLTAGSNISINSVTNTISATDTTYSNFGGATSSVAGSAGLVPAPTTSDPDKFLKGDGAWASVKEHIIYIQFDTVNDRINLYKDENFTIPATAQDLVKNLEAGVNVVGYNDNNMTYLTVTMASDLTDGDSMYFYIHGAAMTQNGEVTGFSVIQETQDNFDTYGAQTYLTPSQRINCVFDSDVFHGATSSIAGTVGLVPAPAAGDEGKALHGDGTWKDTTAKLVEMAYGEANAWTKFINAYNAGSIVYCRASSNANPATGSQTRKAFMAYVNNAATPTEVEFQYVRSVSSKTSSQPVDQVFVYKLTSSGGGTWTVQTRDMAPKIAAGAGISVSYSNGTYTISLA